ncbi:MAG: hypothetical protein AB7O73_14805 [Bacteroidia bacterium]
MKHLISLTIFLLLFGCSTKSNDTAESTQNMPETIKTDTDTNLVNQQNLDSEKFEFTTDSAYDRKLTELSSLLAGKNNINYNYFSEYSRTETFQDYSKTFSKKWNRFDTSKLKSVKEFSNQELVNYESKNTIFYPFSGPDFLFVNTLLPNYSKIVMIGLEPVGTLPIIDDSDLVPDSMEAYLSSVQKSLFAILKFSFFRTKSMKEDLRNDKVDGTIHLLLLFLNKTGCKIQSIKPFHIDENGNKLYLTNTVELKKKSLSNKSIEINFIDSLNHVKQLSYTSANLSDVSFPKNIGLQKFLNNLEIDITYLKGASYLMHYTSFSAIRNLIMEKSKHIIQDDSGIAVKYLLNSSYKWQFNLYGLYTKPIKIFAKEYQPELDSLYQTSTVKNLGFGLGYNYRDKNSSFMIVNKITE